MRPVLLVPAIGVIAAVAFMIWSRQERPPISDAAVPSSPALVGTTPPIPAEAASATQVGARAAAHSPTQQPSSAALATAFAQASDLRLFALNARQHPELGGYFYARLAANICSRDVRVIAAQADTAVRSDVAKTGTVSSDRLASIDSYVRRCSSFAPGEAKEMFDSVNALAQSQDVDPLVRADRDFSSALRRNDQGEIVEAAKRVFAAGDPTLVSMLDVASRLATERNGDTWFDGVKVNDEKERGALQLALQLGTCAVDAYCATDDAMMIACMYRGVCEASRDAYLSHELFASGGSTQDFERVKDLAEKVRSAIGRRDVAAFSRRN